MKKTALFLLAVAVFLLPRLASSQETPSEPKHLIFRSVPFTEVKFNDRFWSPRLTVNREISIPHNFEWCEKTGRFANFAKAAKILQGDFQGIYFNDSDVYKLLEGVAYSLADHPDPALEKRADAVIDWIAAAQLPNGYLNSYFQIREPDKKWTNIVMHELYCAGHMVEAAVAYKRATGKDKLLNVAEKFVDHIIDVFGSLPDGRTAPDPSDGRSHDQRPLFEVPGHEEIELALVKLYELTGKEKYMKQAEQFVDVRGDQSKRGDKIHGAYDQDHEPIREQSEIAGHAVRAVYLYAGVADIAAYTGDQGYIKAMDRLWNDVVNKKMYVTGGIGARHEGEAFGDAFELPNRSAYCETCAAIGLVFWAHRMNLLHGEAKYADIVERAMYNGVLSGIGMDGKHFFYVNPLESVGNHHRQPFFDCACCPTNVVRFLPSLPGYQYAVDKDGALVVNQFIAGKATVELPDGKLELTMKTNYPWDGGYEIGIVPKKNPQSKAEKFTVKVRTPGSPEFDYGNTTTIPWNLPSYVMGDQTYEMKPKRIVANPRVEADRGRVAIMRGPLVYCFEQVDNEVPVLRINLAKNPEFKEEFHKDLLGGVMVLKCKNADGRELTAIPYYAWDHREPGAMAVWVRQQGLAKDQPAWGDDAPLYRELDPKTLSATDATDEDIEPFVTASFCHNSDGIDAVIDGHEPKNSNDHSIPRMTFWNHKGTAEWLEIDFGRTRKISSSSVYWFDDTGRGQCRVPKSATLSYRTENGWKKIETPVGVDRDKFNRIEFDAVETTGFRLDLQLRDDVSGGVLEWKFE